MKALEVKNVSRNFGNLQALSGVSFDLDHGRRQVIIGPNGAGKSTLLHVISGNLLPSSGRIYLFGQEITRMPAHQRADLGLARTFQITNLFPNLTVLENLLLAVHGRQPTRLVFYRPILAYKPLLARATDLLKAWHLWEKRDVKVRNLSYGIQRQIEILLALAGESRLLLLDEPTSGLSAAETQMVLEMVHALGRQVSVLLIEHDMDVAFGVADYVTVLDHGSVVAHGTPAEVKGNPNVTEIYLGTQE